VSAVRLRPAAAADIAAVVRVFRRSVRTALPFLPDLHTAEEDLVHFGSYLGTGRITLAEADGALLGFLVETPGWIEHLYLDPDRRGGGIGRMLVDGAKSRHERLELWCFEQNLAARAFYRAQGFEEVRRTAGENEAGLPDILFAWERG